MIQRIQTIYLLLATILMGMTLITPLATITYSGEFIEEQTVLLKAFSVSGLEGELNTQIPLYLGILLSLPTLLPIITIFLFKKRMIQIRLCISEIVLLVGALAFISIYCYRLYDILSQTYSKMSFSPDMAAFMPLVAILFVGLAIRGIARDEALVRSLDRIR